MTVSDGVSPSSKEGGGGGAGSAPPQNPPLKYVVRTLIIGLNYGSYAHGLRRPIAWGKITTVWRYTVKNIQ